jgi:uncharacterized protein
VIIADTSALLAFFNDREPDHASVRDVVERESRPLVVSPYVVAELDYLVAKRFGVSTELSVLRELGSGAYDLAVLGADDLLVCASLIEKYADQNIGVADASLAVLARRHETRSILTLDRRHFEVVRPLNGGRFTLLGGRKA